MNTFRTCILVVLLASFTVGEPKWYKSLLGIKSKPPKEVKKLNSPTVQDKIAGFIHDIETMNNGIQKRFDKYKMTAQKVFLESVQHVSTLVDVLEKRDPDHKCMLPLLHNLVDLKINTLRDIKGCIESGSRGSSAALESYKRETKSYKEKFNWFVKEIGKCPTCANRLNDLHLESIHSTIGQWYSAHAKYAIEFSKLTSSTASCADVAVTRAESNIFVIERNANCPIDW